MLHCISMSAMLMKCDATAWLSRFNYTYHKCSWTNLWTVLWMPIKNESSRGWLTLTLNRIISLAQNMVSVIIWVGLFSVHILMQAIPTQLEWIFCTLHVAFVCILSIEYIRPFTKYFNSIKPIFFSRTFSLWRKYKLQIPHQSIGQTKLTNGSKNAMQRVIGRTSKTCKFGIVSSCWSFASFASDEMPRTF